MFSAVAALEYAYRGMAHYVIFLIRYAIAAWASDVVAVPASSDVRNAIISCFLAD